MYTRRDSSFGLVLQTGSTRRLEISLRHYKIPERERRPMAKTRLFSFTVLLLFALGTYQLAAAQEEPTTTPQAPAAQADQAVVPDQTPQRSDCSAARPSNCSRKQRGAS